MTTDYDTLVAGSLTEDRAQAARFGFAAAADTNPEAYAEAQRVARRTGVPVATAFNLPGETGKQARVGEIDFDTLAQTSPATAALIADVDRAKLAHDNVANMSEIERKLRMFVGGVWEAGGMLVGGTGELLDVGQRAVLRHYYPMLDATTRDNLMIKAPGAALRGAGGWVKDRARKGIMPAGPQTFGDQVTGGLGQVVGQISMLPLTGFPGLFAQGADVMAEKVAPDLANRDAKDAAVLGGALVTGATEKWALDKLLGPLAVPVKNQIAASLARIGVGAASEGGQEFAENTLQDVLRKALTNRDAEIDLGQSVEEGGVGAAVGGIVRSVVEAGLHIKTRGARRVQEADAGAELLAGLNQLAAADKLLTRDPETFSAFVAQASEDGPVAQVFIDAQILMQSGVAEQVAALSPSVAEQLADAAQTGGQVAIPVEEYATRIAPTAYAHGLLDHLKVEPEGFSRAEAQAYMQSAAAELEAEVGRTLAEQDGDAAFKASADAVRATLRGQLDTAARFTSPVNEAYSALVGDFYAVQASRMGLTPEALYARYPLKIGAERIDGPQFGQSEAVSRLSGEEIAPRDADLKTLRTSARAWYVKHLHGQTFVNNASGREVQFRDGRKAFSTSANPDKLRLFAALREVVEKGVIQNTQVPADQSREPSTKAYHWLTAWVELGGKPVEVGVTIREDQAGHLYYNHNPIEIGASTPLTRSDPAHKAGAGESGEETLKQSVIPAADDINLFVLDQGDGARGSFNPATLDLSLLKNADLSTFLHETGHFFLEVQFDLAAQIATDSAQEGERQIVADADALLRWFGVNSLAEWHALPFEEKRAYHEQFARGFEAYLFEGKAPSIDLQGLFGRFRAWLLRVYRDIKALDVELTDEVRGVMDRMLASNEDIALAEQGRGMLPLFASAEQSGMTPADYAAYQALGHEATQRAVDDLQTRGLRDMQWLRNARGRALKALQREAQTLRAAAELDARSEVRAQPVYQAWSYLTGKIKDTPESIVEDADGLRREAHGKLSLADLEGMDLPAEVINALKARRMTAKEGFHPDFVADLFGFTSGDELVRKLAAATAPKEEIEALTDVRMLEQHGELSNQEAIERAADRAIHNDVRARFVAAEANALAQAVGQRKVLADAAKGYAATLIARRRVRDLRPGQYTGAAAKAARTAEKASKSGDLELAAAEKRNQLIQHYAARAAYDAQDEVEAGLRYLRKFEGSTNLDADYAEQIAQLLERFDLRKAQSLKAIDKRTALAEWVAAQREAGFEPDVPPALLNEAARKSYKDMSVEDFRGLVDTVKQIEHLGRLKHKLLTAADQRSYEAARDEIVAGIRAHAQGRTADTRTPTTNAGRVVQQLKRFWASHIKVATWARVMDGGTDGGPVWNYFVRNANAAGDRETTMRAEATAKLSEILAPVFKLGKMGGKGQFFPSIRRSLNREARLAIALNVGNDGNLQRLLGGENWTEAQILPVLQTLSKEEWGAVQAVWDHFESYRPQIAAKEKRVYGKEPEWVQPGSALTARFGLRGGYYPIKYDPAASQKAEEHTDAEGAKRQLQGAYTTATTRRSFTKARAEEVSGRPLLYTLSGLYSGVNDVIHDLAWHEWLIDTNRLLRSHSIDAAIREHYGPEVKRQFKEWSADVAEGERGADAALDMALGRLRQGVSAAGLGFNAMSALMQPLGLTQSIVRVGAPWVGRGIARYIAQPIDMTREVNDRSEFMANRARTRFRELNELRNQVQDQSTFNELVGRYAYWLMMRCQQAVDVPTWWGAYEKALAAGNEDVRAVALADQAVIDAQGGGQTKDLSSIERGGPAQRLFTVFYSFMNTALNVGVAQTMSADTPAKRAKLAADYLLLYVIPSVLGYALKNAVTPGDSGDDDPEKIAKKLIGAQIDYLFGLMVLAREAAEAGKSLLGVSDFGRDYTGPAGLRFIGDTTNLAKQTHQGEFDTAFRKSLVNVVGDLFGLPSAQINRSVTGAQALAEGKTENPAALAFGFQERR